METPFLWVFDARYGQLTKYNLTPSKAVVAPVADAVEGLFASDGAAAAGDIIR